MKHSTFFRNITGKVVLPVKQNWYRILSVLALILLFNADAWAAGAVDPFDKAAGIISGYGSSVKKLIYIIAGVISIVGGFNVFHKMQNGDQDTKKTAMLVLGGCIALLALTEALPAFFGVKVD